MPIADVMRKGMLVRAIRDKCLDCVGGSPQEVEDCPADKCSLWAYRSPRARRLLRGERPDAQERSEGVGLG